MNGKLKRGQEITDIWIGLQIIFPFQGKAMCEHCKQYGVEKQRSKAAETNHEPIERCGPVYIT